MSTLVLDLTNLSEVLWYLNGGRVKTVLLFVTVDIQEDGEDC